MKIPLVHNEKMENLPMEISIEGKEEELVSNLIEMNIEVKKEITEKSRMASFDYLYYLMDLEIILVELLDKKRISLDDVTSKVDSEMGIYIFNAWLMVYGLVSGDNSFIYFD